MTTHRPTETPRRIAVILGTGPSGRRLLDLVLPLLAHDRGVEMQGVFLEEAGLRHAAELPFVQELCRVTFSLREFNSDQFERALMLRMRSAQRALSVLAKRTGVQHSFRNVRGPAHALLCETARGADITVFEPVGIRSSAAAGQLLSAARPRRLAVAFTNLEAGRMALLAAAHLAENRNDPISILVSPDVARDRERLAALLREMLPGRTLRVRTVAAEAGAGGLVEATQAEGAALLVLTATEELLESRNLQLLREKVRCPICLVRRWGQVS